MTTHVTTRQRYLMKAGDPCTFVAHQAYRPESNITVNKPYPGVITKVNSNMVECVFVNDANEPVRDEQLDGGHGGNANIVTASITVEEMLERTLAEREKQRKELQDNFNVAIHKLETVFTDRLTSIKTTYNL